MSDFALTSPLLPESLIWRSTGCHITKKISYLVVSGILVRTTRHRIIR